MAKLHDFTQDYEYKVGTEKSDSTLCPYSHVTTENIELEVSPNEVNLSSFKLHDELDSNIWKSDNSLHSLIREKLLRIAEDFWKSCNITWVKPNGIILTGSICNFNWSRFSDIDLHLIVNFNEIHERTDFVQEYFDEKKNDWNSEHDSLKVFNYPVELYVQNIDCDVKSGGIYDLLKNKWIRKPQRDELKSIKPNANRIKELSSKIMTDIDDLIDNFHNSSDNESLHKIECHCDKLLSSISSLRKKSLNKEGEMSVGNVIYKVLRRTEYLDKLWKLNTQIYDKLNSISQGSVFEEEIRKQF